MLVGLTPQQFRNRLLECFEVLHRVLTGADQLAIAVEHPDTVDDVDIGIWRKKAQMVRNADNRVEISIVPIELGSAESAIRTDPDGLFSTAYAWRRPLGRRGQRRRGQDAS
jgi:hypothetical protein